MSVATKLQSPVKPLSEGRSVLGPGGNRFRVSEEAKGKNEGLKKPQQPREAPSGVPDAVVRNNLSFESSCSSDSCSSGSSVKMANSNGRVKRNGLKPVKVVPGGVEVPAKRCDWITPNSDPLYTSFHDEEWGVPVYDDKKLFELLALSQALAELSWPTILNKRDIFRKTFDDFDPSSVSKFTEKKLLSLKTTGGTLLSEPKLRAVVENANQILKVQQEFGSFSNYCWSFINNKPMRNGFRYARQVPVKTPKAEVISKDLMQRGFRCVGPTVIYSFMQAAGLVNDHLLTCFRFQECNSSIKKECNSSIKRDLKAKTEEKTGDLTNTLEKTCLSHN